MVHTLLFGGAVAVLAFWWVGTPISLGATPGVVLMCFGELAGLLGSYFVCLQLLLIGRVPWFERAVGMDRLVGWHRSLGTAVVLLVVTHVLLMIVGGAMIDRLTLWSEVLMTLATIPDMVSALVGTAIFLVVGTSSARLARKHLSYEVWFMLHLSIYVGIFLTFAHQITAGTHFVGSLLAQVVWIALYVGTASSLLMWRVVLPLVRHQQTTFRVEQVVPEGAGMVSVWMRGAGLERLSAQGGQFVLVRFLTRGHRWTSHPYSLSTVPTSNMLRVTIAALGDHSSATAHIKPGTRVLVEGPFGRFTAERSTSSGALLIAGGAGIGPIRSISEDLLRRGQDVVVLHRSQTADGLALSSELMDVENLRYEPLPGRRAELGYDPLAPHSILSLVPDVAERDVFVCASESLMEAVVISLRSLGVPRNAIHYEELSMS
ncbi:ferredoxin reductase family protein [Sanguibacter antarcticus]|uniref:Putative ferric reductase n=1 Tax=Sanguibacter antarcticus TaxID=372484 RepID=A0A2A9E2D2_9MICO|nr:ferric reductase-like transmembrane domain-containing protein [Sanguibacter antarcticus]PFG33004.1 putative ferric reductase [Sanguibacter antarcticus]